MKTSTKRLMRGLKYRREHFDIGRKKRAKYYRTMRNAHYGNKQTREQIKKHG